MIVMVKYYAKFGNNCYDKIIPFQNKFRNGM